MPLELRQIIDMKKMTPDESFNVLVSLARQTKLTYQEHQTVEAAVNIVLEALKEKMKPAVPVVVTSPTPTPIATPAGPAPTSKKRQ